MTTKGKATMYVREGKGTILYLAARLANDSKFPFSPTDELEARIVGRRLVLAKVGKRKPKKKATKKTATKKTVTNKKATKKKSGKKAP